MSGNSHQRKVIQTALSNARKKMGVNIAPSASELSGKNTVRNPFPASTPKRALIWCRNVGIGSILLGGVGLMQTFFWPSVIAVYAGIALICLELYFENFERTVWLKYLLFSLILFLAVVFTQVVVLRKSPLTSSYRVINGGLNVVIENDSEDDYEGLDLKIKPDFPNDFVATSKQITNLPGVSFTDALPFVSDVHGESIMATVTTGGSVETEATNPMVNFLRVRVEKLPALSAIRIRLELVRSTSGETTALFSNVQEVLIEGHYRGRFRPIQIREESDREP